MTHAATLLLSLAGFAALALATERVQDDLFVVGHDDLPLSS